MAEPTYRQIEFWVRQGYLKPIVHGGTGHPHQWPVQERRIASLMGRLAEVGFRPAYAADVARTAVTLGGNPICIEVSLAVGLALVVDDSGEAS